MDLSIDLFEKALDLIKDGMSIVFTPKNVAYGDRFLIFSACKELKVTFRWHNLLWVEFEGDDPMLLENCPDSFLESIIKNIEAGNYTINEK
jgi:hypothetical protein